MAVASCDDDRSGSVDIEGDADADAYADDDEDTMALPEVIATPDSSFGVQCTTEAEGCQCDAADCWRSIIAMLPAAGETMLLAYGVRRAATDAGATYADGEVRR